MAELNTIVPVVIYLSLSFLAALWARKQSQKTSDSHGFIEEYFIGGRSMGGFVLAMSIIASYTSASSFVGGPGVAYKLGLSWVLLAMIQVPTTFLTLGVLGKRFAIMARKTRSVTLTDFLRARYRSDAVVVLCSLALLVFFMAAMLAQFIGGARLFQAVTGYPYIVGLRCSGSSGQSCYTARRAGVPGRSVAPRTPSRAWSWFSPPSWCSSPWSTRAAAWNGASPPSKPSIPA
mgnify:CR=1 FL=1